MAQIKSIVDVDNNTLTITVEGKEPIIINSTNLLEAIRNHAVLHGLKQKIVDSAALPSGATLTEKYLAMRDTFERITGMNGAEPSWNKGGDGSSGTATGLLFKALCRLYPAKTPEVLRAYHDKLDKSQQAALRKNPKVAAVIEEIKAESIKTAGIDTNDLLAELEMEEQPQEPAADDTPKRRKTNGVK